MGLNYNGSSARVCINMSSIMLHNKSNDHHFSRRIVRSVLDLRGKIDEYSLIWTINPIILTNSTLKYRIFHFLQHRLARLGKLAAICDWFILLLRSDKFRWLIHFNSINNLTVLIIINVYESFGWIAMTERDREMWR